jgi:GT2 family glycosyltransferase
MKLSIIIVNYNVRYFLEQCLCSVRAALEGIPGEIFVVDNASKDGSRSYLEPSFPEVKFIWNEENRGFAKANNQALRQAGGDYILFLNPDTLVPEACLADCIRFMETHPEAGALGIRMLDGKGQFLPESKRSFPSPLTSFYKLSGLAALFPRSRTFARYHLGHLDEHRDHEVDVLAGAFMMVRREVLDQTGGFDESFFMYGEDIDLSYRVQQALQPATGNPYRNYYFSQASILHFKGESTRKGTLNYVRMFYQAMSLFVQKHYPPSQAGVFSLFIKLAIWLRALLSVARQFVQRIGLPVLDAVLMYLVFWLAKEVWTRYFRPDIQYIRSLLTVSFVGFSLLFLVVSYYTGLYEKKFRYKNLLNSNMVSLIIILAVYSLLPEHFRFSRGMVLLGSLFSFALLAFWRWVLLQANVLEPAETDEERYTVVVGRREDAEAVKQLTSKAGRTPHVRGFVSPLPEEHSLGTPAQLPQILESTPARELILCQGPQLTFGNIIEWYQQLGLRIKLRVHAAGSNSVVGSDSKHYAGEAIGSKEYLLSLPVNRRLKRLADVLLSLVFLFLFPVHFLINRHPLGLLRHCLWVLAGVQTWVGYTGTVSGLPSLPPSVLGPAGVPHRANKLNTEGQELANEWYAQEYEVLYDVVTVFSHYKNLGIS